MAVDLFITHLIEQFFIHISVRKRETLTGKSKS